MILYKTPTSSIVIPGALAVGAHLLLAYVWWSLAPAVTVLSAPPSAMKLLLLASPAPLEQPVTELASLNVTDQTDTLSKTDIMSKADVTSKIDTQAPKKLITSTEITQVQIAQEGLAENAKPPTNTPLTPPKKTSTNQQKSANQAKSVTQPEPLQSLPVPVEQSDEIILATAVTTPVVNDTIVPAEPVGAPVATLDEISTGKASVNNATAAEVLAAQPLTTAPLKYPHRAIMRNQQGLVVMRFHVSAAGKASNLQLLRSSGHRLLDQAVMRYIEGGLFKSATTAGVAIGSEQEFRFRFQLQ